MNKLFSKNIKLIKELHSVKGRKKYSSFIVEGFKTLQECDSAGLIPEYIVIDSTISRLFDKLPEGFKDVKLYETEEFNKVSTLTNGEGILGVFSKSTNFKSEVLDKFLLDKKKIIVLFDISDPGNLGTILRTAVWFGIDGVIIVGNSVDLFSPKVIRSSMGAVFSTAVISIDKFEDNIDRFQDFYKIGTFLDKKIDYNKKEMKKIDKKMILFGNEANGLDEKIYKFVDANYIIGSKKVGNFESLNLSIAVGISIFEIYS